MVIIATLVVTLAAVVHLGIFWMESIGWTRPSVWKRFNVADQAQADSNRDLAFNQGFYNLFLAIGAIVGVVLIGVGNRTAGLTLVYFSVGSMLAASIVLLSLGRKFAAAALTQGLAPLIGLLLTIIATVSGAA